MGVRIRKLSTKDLEYRVELLNTPSISNVLNVSETFNIETTQRWFQKIRTRDDRYDVVIMDDSNVVGMAGLVNISQMDKNAEAYIYVDPAFQGKRYGSKGLKLLLDHAFHKLKLNKVFLYTFAENTRANSFYKKLGFIREGYLKEHTFHKGVLKDRCIYSVLKSDWE